MIVYFVGLLVLASRADGAQPDVLHLRDHRLLPRRAAPAVAADDRRRGRHLDPDQHDHHRVPVAIDRPVVPVRRDHRHPDRRDRLRDGPRRAAVRAERAAPAGRGPAPGRHGRERRAPATARRAGAGGGRARRASPHGARDPRHDRPRPDRHRHPAGGGRAGERPAATTGERHVDNAIRLARESLSEARRSVEASRPEVLEGATLEDGLADVARALVGDQRRPGRVHDDR